MSTTGQYGRRNSARDGPQIHRLRLLGNLQCRHSRDDLRADFIIGVHECRSRVFDEVFRVPHCSIAPGLKFDDIRRIHHLKGRNNREHGQGDRVVKWMGPKPFCNPACIFRPFNGHEHLLNGSVISFHDQGRTGGVRQHAMGDTAKHNFGDSISPSRTNGHEIGVHLLRCIQNNLGGRANLIDCFYDPRVVTDYTGCSV